MVDVVSSDWHLQVQLRMPLANRQVTIEPPQVMGMHMNMNDVHLGLCWWLSGICHRHLPFFLPFD
jgi:hypothetical protein